MKAEAGLPSCKTSASNAVSLARISMMAGSTTRQAAMSAHMLRPPPVVAQDNDVVFLVGGEGGAAAVPGRQENRIAPDPRLQAFAAQGIPDDVDLPVPIKFVLGMLERAAAADIVIRAGRLDAMGRGLDYPEQIAAQDAVGIAADRGLDPVARQRSIDIDGPAARPVYTVTLGTQFMDKQIAGHAFAKACGMRLWGGRRRPGARGLSIALHQARSRSG
ncbi:MAG: hypothetical protein WDN69_28260 [Aliidongia sp.]